MKLAFCILKYFPYGGLQRDFMLIAEECRARGHQIAVYTLSWDGPVPEAFDVRLIRSSAFTNSGNARNFSLGVLEKLEQAPVDGIIGFNPMPGLDVYFAGDVCFVEKARRKHSWLYRLGPRFRTFSALEKGVFAPEAAAAIIYLTERQKQGYISCYGTPADRFRLLPPGISPDRQRPDDAAAVRAAMRESFKLAPEDLALIQVCSSFATKGVARSIEALASLPEPLRARTHYWVVGNDSPGRFASLAQSYGLGGNVVFTGARDDVSALLLGADLMIHPAVTEAAGTVLVEAMAAGLPILCSDACGYASYISKASAGRVVPEPFEQAALNRELLELLSNADLPALGQNARRFASAESFHRRSQCAADIIETVVSRKRQCSI